MALPSLCISTRNASIGEALPDKMHSGFCSSNVGRKKNLCTQNSSWEYELPSKLHGVYLVSSKLSLLEPETETTHTLQHHMVTNKTNKSVDTRDAKMLQTVFDVTTPIFILSGSVNEDNLTTFHSSLRQAKPLIPSNNNYLSMPKFLWMHFS